MVVAGSSNFHLDSLVMRRVNRRRHRMIPVMIELLRSLSSFITMAVVIAWCSVVVGQSSSTAEREPLPTPEAEVEIDALIQQMGSAKYRLRKQAENKLRQKGLLAIEALRQVHESEDLEVRLRARRLVEQLQQHFIEESVPPVLQPRFRDYTEKSDAARQDCIESVISIAGLDGLRLLGRLARFEQSELLSKEAALMVLQTKLDAPGTGRDLVDLQRTLRAAIGFSKRPAANWISYYIDSYDSPEKGLDEMAQVLQRERDLLANGSPNTNQNIVDNLGRFRVNLLLKAGHPDQAMREMSQVAMKETDPVKFLRTIDWLIDRSAWQEVDDISKAQRERFGKDALIMYRFAEARRRAGNAEQAEELADAAFQTKGNGVQRFARYYGSVLGGWGDDVLRSPDQLALQQFVIARLLEDDRGQFDWAEREYLEVIKSKEVGRAEQGRQYLVMMYHDLNRDKEAAEVMEQLLKNTKNSPALEVEFKGRLHFYRACQAKHDGDRHAELAELEKAVAANPEEIDAVIALYHSPVASKEQHDRTVKMVQRLAKEFHTAIEKNHQDVLNARRDYRTESEFDLATSENQYAWLVGNTEGDIHEAIRVSLHSLQITPGAAGYIDTLGRCYFRAGDIQNALKYQRQAVELAPHEQQIRRQLELFEATAAEQELNAADADDSLDARPKGESMLSGDPPQSPDKDRTPEAIHDDPS